nr:putative ribonuclease H-like domain-containing protein [Tanacetum cinerariifolium]
MLHLEGILKVGHTQEEGIDYCEVFAPVARIEAIRLFLAYASFMGFMVYQMDVKSTFLYETIKEEIYVCQPPGFEDPGYPDKVYKVVKALYGLRQAHRAWYETLANYLLENGFQRGKIDQTLFINMQKGDILLVQVYVDDIIFGSTNKELSSTPIETEKPLLKDPDGEDVDVHIYREVRARTLFVLSSSNRKSELWPALSRNSPLNKCLGGEQKSRCTKQDCVHQLTVVEEEGNTWMTPIHEYLVEEILPEEKKKARVIRRKARRYAVTNGVLYKKSFLRLWLRCVGPLKANYVLREIHEGSCSMHAGPRFVVAKALR